MVENWILCKCGCGTKIPTHDKRGRPRFYVAGHSRKGKSNYWKLKKDSDISKRTARERAVKAVDVLDCAVCFIGGCSKRLEVHHLDEDPWNNAPTNLCVLCTSHHRLVHSGALDLENPTMPDFYVDGPGKRRYIKQV